MAHSLDVENSRLLSESEGSDETGQARSRSSWHFGRASMLSLGLIAIVCAAAFAMRFAQSAAMTSLAPAEETVIEESSLQARIEALRHKLDQLIEQKDLPVGVAPLVQPMPMKPLGSLSNLGPALVQPAKQLPTAAPPMAPPTTALPTTSHLRSPTVSTSPSNLTIWKDPFSTFCFMVAIPSEMPVIRWQFKRGAGIFQCTSWRVYSGASEALRIGTHPDGRVAKTTPIPGPKAFFGKAYFWGCDHSTKYLMNANVLSRAWENAQEDGVAGLHSWIIKVDPDSVLSHSRLRKILVEKHHEEQDKKSKTVGRYFKNCRAMSSMQGSMEILSREAFYLFTGKKKECQNSMDWWHMGEDIFTNKCLQQIGVKAGDIAEGVMDTYCAKSKSCVQHRGQPNCSLPEVALFHPLKTLDEFANCWDEIQRVDEQSQVPKGAEHVSAYAASM